MLKNILDKIKRFKNLSSQFKEKKTQRSILVHPDFLPPAVQFAGGKYNIVQLEEDVILYRAGNSTESPFGRWFTLYPPKSVTQVRIDKAIKPQWINPKTGYCNALISINGYYVFKALKGTTLYIGPVANQGDVYVGGSEPNQTHIFVWEGVKNWDLLGFTSFK